MAWRWPEVSIPGGYQHRAICRETAGRARSVAATPTVLLVTDRVGDSVQVTNSTAVAIAPGWCSELIQPALQSVVVVNDRPETLGLRPIASLDFGPGRPVFSHWAGVEGVVWGHAATTRGPSEIGGTWEESRKTLFF